MVAQHFKDVELIDSNSRRSWSTKTNYTDMLDLYILPRWETTRMLDVKTVAVEDWLAVLECKTKPGKPLANPTKQRIRNVFSVLFTHAQRYEFVPIGHNPIKLVRQSGKRSTIPDILTPSEINGLWQGAGARDRAAISLEYGNGPRISEAVGLKWSDLDLAKGTASVTRGVVNNHVGDLKTEVSRKVVPLHPYQVEDLRAWRALSKYNGDDDWVFASPRKKGTQPLWSNTILDRVIRPLAARLGISKRIGWHTFRRTFSSLLADNEDSVSTVQQLMRHANPGTTFGLYAQAVPERLRTAQAKVIEMVRSAPLPERPQAHEASVQA